jgi:hypothetical protein
MFPNKNIQNSTSKVYPGYTRVGVLKEQNTNVTSSVMCVCMKGKSDETTREKF